MLGCARLYTHSYTACIWKLLLYLFVTVQNGSNNVSSFLLSFFFVCLFKKRNNFRYTLCICACGIYVIVFISSAVFLYIYTYSVHTYSVYINSFSWFCCDHVGAFRSVSKCLYISGDFWICRRFTVSIYPIKHLPVTLHTTHLGMGCSLKGRCTIYRLNQLDLVRHDPMHLLLWQHCIIKTCPDILLCISYVKNYVFLRCSGGFCWQIHYMDKRIGTPTLLYPFMCFCWSNCLSTLLFSLEVGTLL